MRGIRRDDADITLMQRVPYPLDRSISSAVIHTENLKKFMLMRKNRCVGDFANFLFGCTFVVPAGLIYRLHNVKSRKHAVMGMAAGTVLTTAAACLMNAFVLLPAYGKAFGMPIEAFIEMGAAVNHSVNSLLGFVALIIVPFNLFKYILMSVIVFFIYKRIRVVLKGD